MIDNKVAASGILTLDLASYCQQEIVPFDLQPFLFRGLILKEKDFREALKTTDYNTFQDKNVTLFCSADAIIPVWAYALATVHLRPFASHVFYGTEEETRNRLIEQAIRKSIHPEDYEGARLVLKGCGDVNVPPVAYITAAEMLQPVVQSLMFGEPCSTVPLYKKKAALKTSV